MAGIRVGLYFTITFCDICWWRGVVLLRRWAILAIEFSGFQCFGRWGLLRFSHVGIAFATTFGVCGVTIVTGFHGFGFAYFP